MTTQINIKLEDDLMNEVNYILKSMGLSMTTAVRMFFTRVKNDRAIPFEIRASEEPNEETRRALISEDFEEIKDIKDIWS